MWPVTVAEPDLSNAGEIPEDTFAVRIAIVRAMRGWNYVQAAEACDISKENWRLWEKTHRSPHDYEEVCRKIARGSGFDRRWLSAGGPLRNRCVAACPDIEGQMELALGIADRTLVAI